MLKRFTSIYFSALVFLLLAAVALVAAYFSSIAISSHNIFSTSNMTLVMSDSDEAESVSISDSWGAIDLVPGALIPSTKIDIANVSEVDGDHIDISFSYTGSEDLAKNMILNNMGTGFRYGGRDDSVSVNLNTGLRGYSDTDYILSQGETGEPFTSTTVDGADGTTPNGLISINELAAFGMIRIQSGDENNGIAAGTTAELWLNASIMTALTAQDESIDVTITAKLDQVPQQY